MSESEITPDGKDWTWVLSEVCPECRYDVRSFPQEDIGSLIRRNAAAWQALIAGVDDHALRQRPRPDKWSPLEYSAHVRDVYRLYDYRLGLMLDEEDPSYPNWDQDETAIAEDYNSQDPATVSVEVGEAADKLATRFDGVVGDQWQRKGHRGDGAEFTVSTFARYLIHDPVHHLWDVQNSD